MHCQKPKLSLCLCQKKTKTTCVTQSAAAVTAGRPTPSLLGQLARPTNDSWNFQIVSAAQCCELPSSLGGAGRGQPSLRCSAAVQCEEGGQEDDLLAEERGFCRTKRPGVQTFGQFWVGVAGVLGWYGMD